MGQVIVPIDLSYAAGGVWFFRFIGRWLWWVYEQSMLAICGTVKIVTRQNRHPAKSSPGKIVTLWQRWLDEIVCFRLYSTAGAMAHRMPADRSGQAARMLCS